MRNTILDNLKDGIDQYLGSGTEFSDPKVEMVSTIVPESITVTRFIGIEIERAEPNDREIGSFSASSDKYICTVTALVRGANHDIIKSEIDTIVLRVRKFFNDDIGGLLGLEKTSDSIKEAVISYGITGREYVSGAMKDGSLGETCIITVEILTNVFF